MEKKKVKLIVADIDGTIRWDFKALTPRTVAAIEALKKQGIYFGIASGRSLKNVTGYAYEWGLDHQFDLCIAINGAQIYDNVSGRTLQDQQMHSEDVRKIIEHFAPLHLEASFFTDSDIQYVTGLNERMRDAQKRNHYEYVVVKGDYSVFDEIPVNKVMFRVNEEFMAEVERFERENPLEGYHGFKTQPYCFEVMPSGIDKAKAIRTFCQYHEIPHDQVMTFGDTTNDNSMLAAFYGVAMKNATDDTKAVAKEITEYSAADDGFARYLEDHILD